MHPGDPATGSLSTSSSLLERVRLHDEEAWARLVAVYGPVIYRWARQGALQPADAADLVQEVFASVARHLGQFRKSGPADSFRGWLYSITRNHVRLHYRRRQGRAEADGGSVAYQRLQALSAEGDAPSAEQLDGMAAIWRRALETAQDYFEPHTWQAFWRTAVEGESPADVASDLGISVWSVYQAKSRVLRRLRTDWRDLLD